jgi:serine/threonine protein phosphatase PrpC
VVAVYDGQAHQLNVANVGDSVCVLSDAGKAVMINKMHRIDEPSERERILRSGGTILNNRVNGVLAITRAFGDCAFKANDGPIIGVPEISTIDITESIEFAILATDGLWDVISPQAAVNFIRRQLYAKYTIADSVKNLVMEALHAGSIDNVTILLMVFHIPAIA